jgi:hypothetical protein
MLIRNSSTFGSARISVFILRTENQLVQHWILVDVFCCFPGLTIRLHLVDADAFAAGTRHEAPNRASFLGHLRFRFLRNLCSIHLACARVR